MKPSNVLALIFLGIATAALAADTGPIGPGGRPIAPTPTPATVMSITGYPTTSGTGTRRAVLVTTAGRLAVDSGSSSGGGSVTQGTSPWVVSGTVTATGPLTDAQLRASAVPVSGTFFQATQPVSGTVAATQSGAWNIGTVTTITNPVTVTDGAGALNVIVDSGVLTTVSAVTAITNALPAGANVIGHVIADSGSTTVVTGNVTAVQATGTNLHTVVDSGAITVSGTVTTTPPSNASTNVAQFGGSNVVTGTGTSGAGIPRVTVASDSSTVVTQATGTNLHAVLDSGTTTVTQATGTNLHTVVDSGTITTITNPVTVTDGAGALNVIVDSGTVTANQGGAPWTVTGTLSNNNAAPSTNHIAALQAVANASAPTFTEGNEVLLSTDLSGRNRTIAASETQLSQPLLLPGAYVMLVVPVAAPAVNNLLPRCNALQRVRCR